MEEYIWQQQNTVAQYIATQSLLDMGEGLERALGEQLGMRWWYQADINLVGAREAAKATAAAEKAVGEE